MAPSVCTPSPPSTSVDWSRVRLSVDPAPTMFIARWSAESHPGSGSGSGSGSEGCWDGGELVPYGPLALLPAAQVLNYGQSIFEGLKAYRRDTPPHSRQQQQQQFDGSSGSGEQQQQWAEEEGSGSVLLFRPDANAARFAAGARRMCMPPVPPALFLAALHAVVRANREWVPPASRGSLYLRPLLLGSGPLLGLCPAPSYTFVVYAVPVGSRAKGGRLASLDYLIHDSLHRAAPRGVGATKAAGNYSPCLLAQAQAREAGCHDCLYLDARSDTYLEEGSGCNVFVAHGSVLSTPPAAGSILPGVTRASLLQLAAEALGLAVREAPVTVQEAMKADEMFASGTAVVVQPIGSLTYRGTKVSFGAGTAAAAAGGQPPATATAPEPTANGHHACATSGADGERAVSAAGGPDDGERDGPSGPANRSNGGGGDVCCGGSSSSSGSSSSGGGTPVVDGVLPADHHHLGPQEEEAEGDDDGGEAAASLPPYLRNCFGRTVPYLAPEQRAALAAAVPPPEAGSLPPGVGPIAQRLYGLLTAIQYGRVADPFGWMVEVDMAGPTAGPLHLDRMLAELESEEEEVEETEAEETEAEEPATPATPSTGSPPGTTGPGWGRRSGCGLPPVSSLDSFGRAPSISSKKAAKAASRAGGGRVLAGARSVFADPNLE